MKSNSPVPKRTPVARSQIARVILRTMRLEEPGMSEALARKISHKVKFPS